MVESRSMVNGPSTGPAPVAQARASNSRLTRTVGSCAGPQRRRRGRDHWCWPGPGSFTEFGEFGRIKDNRSGTDHGAGGGSFIIGERVSGGLYAEYPPLDPAQWFDGEDLRHTFDFRGLYGAILEQWLGLDAAPIVGGAFEQVRPFN